MEKSFWNGLLLNIIGVRVPIRVQSLVGNNVVHKKCFEVFLAEAAEKEAVDYWTKLSKSKI